MSSVLAVSADYEDPTLGNYVASFFLISWFSSWVKVDISSFRGSKFPLIPFLIRSGKTPLMGSSTLSESRATGASAVFSAFTDLCRTQF